jgi:hypothetical protein
MSQEELIAGCANASSAGEASWSGPFFVSEPSELKKIFRLREAVWRNESSLVDVSRLDPDAAMLHDAHEGRALHWAVTVGDTIIAAARLCICDDAIDLPYTDEIQRMITDLPGPFAALDRLVVHPSMRRRDLSRALTDVRIKAARSRRVRSIVVEAAPNRIPPLLDLGFVDLGPTPGEPWDLAPFTLLALDLSA